MSTSGTYALLLYLAAPQTVVVGALGAQDLPSGWYLYLGSARGPGGLEARLARHRREIDKRKHWHIDFVRAVMELVEVWTTAGAERQECAWAAAAAELPGAVVVSHLGASDCRCPTHLFHYAARPHSSEFEPLIQAHLRCEHLGVGGGRKGADAHTRERARKANLGGIELCAT
jgi:Uri superfamily endonuclease